MRKALKGTTKHVEIEPPKSPAEKAAAAEAAAAAAGGGEDGGGGATGFDAAEGARGVSKLLPISIDGGGGGEGDSDGGGGSGGGGGATVARYRAPPSGLPVVAEAGESAELSKVGTGSPQQLIRVTPMTTRARLPTLPGVGEAAELGEADSGIILEAASQY